MTLPARWTEPPIRFHPVQQAYWASRKRFNIIPAGRRSGKTEFFKRKVVRAAIRGTKYDRSHFFAAAPTHQQAKRIYWRDLKVLMPREHMLGTPSESELVIRTVTGSDLHVIGLDKPERFEGSPWDGGGIDEYANVKQKAWQENIFPALADRQGWCDRFGVPEGRNHYWEESELALERIAKDPDCPFGWFHWISADILPPDEIALAKQTLDPLSYQQEYEASFVNFSGQAYYPFSRETHTGNLDYRPRAPLIFCFDFNVDPGVAAVIQEQMLPNGQDGTGIIGEVHIPRNSNTVAVCRKLVEDWGEHQGKVVCYGDYTGGARGSAKVQGSDWDLIKQELRKTFKSGLAFRVPPNPKEADRINSMNTRLLTLNGDVRMMVDARMCSNIIKDFEGTVLLEGGAREIDKNATPALTHLTDAIGYYVDHEFPVREREMQKTKLQGR